MINNDRQNKTSTQLNSQGTNTLFKVNIKKSQDKRSDI